MIQALREWRDLLSTDSAPPFSAIAVQRSVERGAMMTHKLTFPPRSDYLLEEDAEEDAIKLWVTHSTTLGRLSFGMPD